MCRFDWVRISPQSNRQYDLDDQTEFHILKVELSWSALLFVCTLYENWKIVELMSSTYNIWSQWENN
jgi:hypothetical protein